jgi:hypothetical protein
MRILGCAQAFNRDDFGSIQICHFGQARTDGPPVYHNRTGTALPLAITGLFGTSQSKIFPKEIEQNPVRVNDKLVGAPVDS